MKPTTMRAAAPAMISFRERGFAVVAPATPLIFALGSDLAGEAAAACAARRAAAMKFGFSPASVITGGFAALTAASDAAIRSAAE